MKTRRLIIPGYVAQISGELEECLPGWEIVVGPQEAADLAPFLKMQTPAKRVRGRMEELGVRKRFSRSQRGIVTVWKGAKARLERNIGRLIQ